ncbi:MAG: type III pantothenate kinase [Bacteroidetes bacterium]|nr:MAG: type III pantothenate kinase [Bacteroidota bacterium]
MNLAIDFGNTSVKAGIFENNILKEKLTGITSVELSRVINAHPDYNLILCSVSSESTHFLNLIEKKDKLTILDYKTAIPITNLYETPETLGMDRLAAAVGAFTLYPNSDCLIIDAGTCITYDFLDAKAQFHGGSISPGIKMRFKALQHFTAKLPLIDTLEYVDIFGKNTSDAIKVGVLQGFKGEVESIIAVFCQKYPNINIIVTGGDISFFETKIKHSIFAVPDLVLIGLNKILNEQINV